MRWIHSWCACLAFLGALGACSVASSGLGGDDSIELDAGPSIDTGLGDAGAAPDLGRDVLSDAAEVASASDAADTLGTLDAADAADAADAPDTIDAADTADTADTAPPPLCSGNPDIVACYRFENDGFARQPHDESLYGNHGSTFTGASFVPGVHGSAVAVNGASAITVPDSASLDVTHITMELRFRPASLPTGTRAGLLDDDGQYGIFILNGGKVRCSIAAPTSATLDSPAVVAVVGRWTHLACTYDGAALVMYVDGVPVTYGAGAGDMIGTATVGMAIGMNSPTGDNFDGALDDLRLWRRALTTPEICASARGVVGATCP